MFVNMSLFKLAVRIFFKSGRRGGGRQEVGHSKFGTILQKLNNFLNNFLLKLLTAISEQAIYEKFISEQKTENRIHFESTVQELRGFFYSPAMPILCQNLRFSINKMKICIRILNCLKNVVQPTNPELAVTNPNLP